MHTTTILTTLALAASAFAAPTPETDATSKLYALKTISSDKRFNGLCVENYHTGAGTADAVLSKCTKDSYSYYSNATAIETTKLVAAPAHGGLIISGTGTMYDSWYPVVVDAGDGTRGLSYNASAGFVQAGGAGFLACNWAHYGLPQLFSFAYPDQQTIKTSNCAKVKLVKA